MPPPAVACHDSFSCGGSDLSNRAFATVARRKDTIDIGLHGTALRRHKIALGKLDKTFQKFSVGHQTNEHEYAIGVARLDSTTLVHLRRGFLTPQLGILGQHFERDGSCR